MRIAAIRIPLFPLAARLRCEPELAEEPLVILEGNARAARIVAASRAARRAGIRAGQSLPQARALLPRLATRPRDAEAERATQESLLEVAEAFSPRVEEAGEGSAWLEISGLERHFDGPDPESELARLLIREAEAVGVPVWVGIAGSKLAATVAASLSDSPQLVPAGREAAFLAPLPLARLDPELGVAETLARWGIRSIGDLAALPVADVTSRLGEVGRTLHAAARGLDPRPLIARPPPETFQEGLELEWPLVALEPFLFIARNALDRLCRRLRQRGLACARVELSLTLEPEGFHERSITLPAPTHEAKTLLTLIRLELERTAPGAPVTAFRITAYPDRPRVAQLSLFGPAELPPDRLATTLARLFALLGAEKVGSPRPADAHRPEAFELVEFAPPPPPKVSPPTTRSRGLLGIRVLRPPVPLEVIVDEKAPGEGCFPIPRAIRSQPGEEVPNRLQIRGSVQVASGPWFVEEGWWQAEPVSRAYWDVELGGGELYRIYRQQTDWFADGIYD